MTSQTCISPLVIVPVLSSATILIFPAISIAGAFLNRIPFLAPTPLPTIIATGVARPRAQGQDITKTDIPLARAYPTSLFINNQIIVVINAIPRIIGTNIPDTLSAIFAIGAFVADASSTILTIWDKVVSFPTRVALHFKKLVRLMVPLNTSLSLVLSWGILSPVKEDSFIELWPSIIIPSTGIESPGLTINMSPITTSSTFIVISLPSLITFAVSGASSNKPLIAFVVFPFEYDSKVLPIVIRVKIIADDSKYRFINNSCASSKLPFAWEIAINTNSYKLHKNPIADPIATRVSMFGALWNMALNPLIKKCLFITIIMHVNTSSIIAMLIGLCNKNWGRGHENIICPIVKYISINKNTKDEINLFNRAIVCSSLNAVFFFVLSISLWIDAP